MSVAGVHQVAAGGVQDSFGFACGAGGIEDEKESSAFMRSGAHSVA